MSPLQVAVIVPTLRRPDSLERALRSLFLQTGVADRLHEIVVVDNDPAASSRDAVDQLRPASPVPLIWRHAPRPGVATARNEGLAATAAPLIAFLDDDEAASPAWRIAALRDWSCPDRPSASPSTTFPPAPPTRGLRLWRRMMYAAPSTSAPAFSGGRATWAVSPTPPRPAT